MYLPPPRSPLFPYTTLFRSAVTGSAPATGTTESARATATAARPAASVRKLRVQASAKFRVTDGRSEEHTSELQSRRDLVCRLLLEKKKKNKSTQISRCNTLG